MQTQHLIPGAAAGGIVGSSRGYRNVKTTVTVVFLAAILLTSVIVTGRAYAAGNSRCKYCDSTSYGVNCPYGPDRIHEHLEDDRACVFCGSSSYGMNCPYGANRKHRHGHGSNRCVWCGSSSLGRNCPYSPRRYHER